MESTLAASEEGTIASLDYKLPSVASYVEARTESTFFPQGGNHFSSTGVRTLTFAMSGNGSADLSSLVLKSKVVNDDGSNALKPITCDAACLFSELRILCSGIEVERLGGSGGASYA